MRFERTHRLPCLTAFKAAHLNRLGTAPYKNRLPIIRHTVKYINILYIALFEHNKKNGADNPTDDAVEAKETSMARPFLKIFTRWQILAFFIGDGFKSHRLDPFHSTLQV